MFVVVIDDGNENMKWIEKTIVMVAADEMDRDHDKWMKIDGNENLKRYDIDILVCLVLVCMFFEGINEMNET